ncbi:MULTISPECIES: hypothetical protein [Pseudanabaena]|uniref:Uncharacterized protein n=2 Tax=Pseudanabaena TaxID=1152 RepID=L8MXX6_9CYAN|nr:MULTISPECIES: hypothetical protein [Pseudanabaena]ELS32857.1 hypothetical protein Pse7429DRAFT_1283 [Pseudanabaena biceps PCC 7429]MDG3494908.1 hypothetical protein [Pseudanabaena catenata USMAC16]
MRSEPSIFASNTDNSDTEQNAGLSMVDILTLSPRQHHILHWIMRQQQVTLEAIAAYTEADLEDIRNDLEALVSQGFIEMRQNQGLIYYEIDFRNQQNTEALGNIASASVAIRPLSIILNPSGVVSITTGESFELCITVTNQGDRSAVISVALDRDSSSIYAWCPYPSETLALSVGQSCEVVFQIQVPPTTTPDEYGYTLIIDAPQHYPEHTPIQYKGRVIVLPALQEVVRVNDPTFVTLPRTTSDNPHPMRSGEIWQLLIGVTNRSERVDRFRVTIPDLDPKWFSIYYPEGLALAGVVEAADGLPLNPDTQGQINLILKPPLDVWAGIYAPTIRVHSANNPDLSLLDIAYFEILPTYQLDIQLVTILTRVNNQPSVYEMRFKSKGNIARELTLRASSPEQEGLLIYNLEQEEIKISPFGTVKVNIAIETTKKCKPKFWGDRYLSFIIELEDKQDALLPNDRYLGNVLVPARPWWQFVLLILGILGLIGTVIFLIWWFFFRPPDVPQVVEFTSESSTYKESENEAIRLRWRISYPELVREIRVEGLSPDEKILSQPVVYNFTKGIPPELKDYCVIDRELLCQNVPTDARKPSQYIFQMNLSSKNPKTAAIPLVKTSKILVEPLPQSQIVEFTSTKPLYTESKPVLPVVVSKPVKTGDNPSPESLSTSGSVSSNVADSRPSDSRSSDATSDTASTSSTVSSTVSSSELSLLAGALEKRVFLTALGIGGEANKFRIIRPKPDLDNEVRLNWRISNASQVRELTLVGRSPEGEVKSPPLRFVFAEGLPRSLSPYCTIANDEMTCRNVPTEAKASGNYIFELAIVPTKPPEDPKAVPVTRKTEIAKIAPYPAKILELKVNGQDALPQYSFNLNPDVPSILTLSWKIEASAAAKIDLLPAPGNIAAVGQLALPLSPKSGEVTYTLQVTNPDGQVVMRSFIVQTIAPPPAPKSETPPPIALPPDIPEIDSPLIPNSASNGSGNRRSGGMLLPSEVPPSQK